MATATLELINPYSKYGLKRRPTYNEIIGLIGENETLTGQLPDRTATQFKASQEGSFFDGLDHLEILKEQQNRIQERQIRELLLRQNLGGRTYNVERFRRQRDENTPPEPETPSSGDDALASSGLRRDGMASAGMQTELQRRATAFANRQQQTGEAHQGLLSRSTSSIMDGISGGFSPLSRTGSRPQTPALQMPQPKREQGTPEVINIASDVEEVSSGEMLTAREQQQPVEQATGFLNTNRVGVEPKSAVLRTISYRTNIGTMSEEALKFQLYIRGVDVDDPENSLEGLKKKGKGRGKTVKAHYLEIAQQMLNDDKWETRVEEELLKRRINEYRSKGKARGSTD